MSMQSQLIGTETDNVRKMANGRVHLVKIPPRVLYLVLLILLVVIIVLLLPHKPHSEGHLAGVTMTNSQDAELYTYDSTYPLTKPFGKHVYSQVTHVAMRMFIHRHVHTCMYMYILYMYMYVCKYVHNHYEHASR